MEQRIKLQRILEDLLESKYVYFQPPSSMRIEYPCIIYERAPDDRKYANGQLYKRMRKYNLIVIDRNSDTEIPDKISKLPLVSFNKCYMMNNLNHYSFTIYY